MMSRIALRNVMPIVLAFLIGLPLIYWVLNDTDPTEIYVREVVQSKVPANSVLLIHSIVFNHRRCPSTTISKMIDSAGQAHSLPNRIGNPIRNLGYLDNAKMPGEIELPPDLPLGQTQYLTTTVYGVDWGEYCFAQHVIERSPLTFEIIAPEGG